jgi:hypothetical protein
MILVSHSIVGAALTHRSLGFVTVFFVGVASHYIMDMIPHWHYNVPHIKHAVNETRGVKTLSMKASLIPEFMYIAIDLMLGFLLSFIIFGGSWEIIAVGVLGAVVPDLLVGLGRFFPVSILVRHDQFHRWVHSNIMLDDSPIIGILCQAATVFLFIYVFR